MTRALAGKTALITGAASGMGRAAAERFAAEGARVVLFGLGGAALDQAAAACIGDGHVAAHGNVTHDIDIAHAIAACDGALDVVVTAAGIITIDDPLTVSPATWERAFAVNVTGTMLTVQAALPLLIASGSGAIVTIASVAAFSAKAGSTSYAMSKAALVSYTRSVAQAHGADGVRANCVAPGWVRTPMSEHEMDLEAAAKGTTRDAEFAALAERIALRRVAAASEIAACCLFLASSEASFVTGATLVADGGGRAPVAARAV